MPHRKQVSRKGLSKLNRRVHYCKQLHKQVRRHRPVLKPEHKPIHSLGWALSQVLLEQQQAVEEGVAEVEVTPEEERPLSLDHLPM